MFQLWWCGKKSFWCRDLWVWFWRSQARGWGWAVFQTNMRNQCKGPPRNVDVCVQGNTKRPEWLEWREWVERLLDEVRECTGANCVKIFQNSPHKISFHHWNSSSLPLRVSTLSSGKGSCLIYCYVPHRPVLCLSLGWVFKYLNIQYNIQVNIQI